MFAHRSHLAHADNALAEKGLGRAHHRVLYFVARKPGANVSDLLSTLGITKQSLGRVLNDLSREDLLELRVGERDRRTRLLFLTDAGQQLENELFQQLRDNMERAYSISGEQAVHGYWTMMQNLMSADVRRNFASFNSLNAKSV